MNALLSLDVSASHVPSQLHYLPCYSVYWRLVHELHHHILIPPLNLVPVRVQLHRRLHKLCLHPYMVVVYLDVEQALQSVPYALHVHHVLNLQSKPLHSETSIECLEKKFWCH